MVLGFDWSIGPWMHDALWRMAKSRAYVLCKCMGLYKARDQVSLTNGTPPRFWSIDGERESTTQT
jgi:hypothetical protein